MLWFRLFMKSCLIFCTGYYFFAFGVLWYVIIEVHVGFAAYMNLYFINFDDFVILSTEISFTLLITRSLNCSPDRLEQIYSFRDVDGFHSIPSQNGFFAFFCGN